MMSDHSEPGAHLATRMPQPEPLLPSDPPKIGDFWLDSRLAAAPSGVAFLAHETGDENPVMVVMLSQGASNDSAARDRFAGEVNKMHIDTVVARGGEGQDDGRLAVRFRSEEDDPDLPDAWPLAPWVALAYDGSPMALAEAERLLATVDLSRAAPLSDPSGPSYRLHWIDETSTGTWRVWPLPWPGRHDRAGWVTIFISWLLMVLMAALALLIAVLIFSNAPEQAPPPPVPTQAEGSGEPTSASPSDQSASPSGSEEEPTPTNTPSMRTAQPSSTASGEDASPSPNRRL